MKKCKYKCGLGFAKTIIWGKDFAKPRLLIFWNSAGFRFGFCPQEGFGEECGRGNQTAQMGKNEPFGNWEKFKTQSNIVPPSFPNWCPWFSGVHPRSSDLGHFRYGYSRLGAYVRAKPAPLRERKFPLPGSGSADYSSPPSPYPHHAFYIYVYLFLRFQLFDTSVYHGAHPLAIGRHSGNARGSNANACPDSLWLHKLSSPPMRAGRLLLPFLLQFGIWYRFSCFWVLFDFVFFL